MKKYKLLIAGMAIGALSLTMLSGCGNVTEEPAASVTEETVVEETAKPAPEIIVGDDKVRENSSGDSSKTDSVAETEAETTVDDSSSETDAESTSEDFHVTNCGFDEGFNKTDELTSDGAIKVILKTTEAIKDEDYHKMIQYTNIGDIMRLSDDKNQRPMTDEEIIVQLEANGFNMDGLSQYADELEQADEVSADDFEDCVRMTEAEIAELNSFFSNEELFGTSNFKPYYTDGWKLSPKVDKEALNSIAQGSEDMSGFISELSKFYVLKDTQGEWKMDIGLHYVIALYSMMADSMTAE